MSSAPSAPNIVARPRVYAGEIRFYWQPPSSDGGSAVTKYTLACASISYSQDLSANVANYLVTGLTDRADLTFTLTATNAVGTSPAATFRTVQAGAAPFGPTVATVSTLNASTALVTWDLSTISTEGSPRWFVITTVPSTTSMSSFKRCSYIYQRARTFQVPSTNIYYQYLVQAVNDTGYCRPFAYTSTVGFGVPTGPGPFSPSSIANLRIWYDAQDSATITRSLSSITQWADKSGSGLTMGRVGTTQVTYHTTGVNGYPAIYLNATAGLSTSAFVLSQTSQLTYYMVLNQTGLAGGGNGDIFFNTTDYRVFDIFSKQGTSNITIDLGSGDENATGSNISGQNALLGLVTNTSNANAYINASSVLAFTPANTYPMNLSQVYQIGASKFIGNIGEVMAYSNALTPFDRQKVEGYLGWKWGLQASLPATHPFKTAAPTVSSVFSPSSFSGLQMWLDANDPLGTGVTPSNGASITTWADKSGNGRNAISVSTAATVVTGALNSKAVLNTTGTSRYNVTYGSIPASYSAFAMYTITSNDGAYQRVLHGATDNTLFLGVQGGQNVATFVGNGSSWNDFAANSPTISALNTWRMVAMLNNSSNTQLTPFTDGSAQTAKTGSATSFSDLVVMSHASSGDPQRLKGRLAEVLFYNRVLSADDRQTVEGYLAWKWGLQGNLPTTHPYKFLSPASNYAGDVVPQNLLVRFDAATYSGSGAWANTGALGSLANASNNAGSPTKNGAGNGIVFNSANTWICPPTGTVSFGTFTSYTFSTWYKRMGAIDTNDSVVQAFVGGGGGTAFYMSRRDPQYDNNTELRLNTYDGGSVIIQGTNYSFPLNTWVQFTVTHNGSSLTTYVNGSAIGTVAATAVPAMGGGFYIGYNGSSGILNSSEIGQILIYNRVLTAAEVAQNYAATSSTFSV